MGPTGPAVTVDDLTRITCPVLVVVAHDVGTLSHAITMFDALSDGQLALTPSASHLLHHERAGTLTSLIEAFLADPTPRPLMPIRRSPQPQPS
jgi:pimeloyl-ACP methyl ester carboxylesterase